MSQEGQQRNHGAAEVNPAISGRDTPAPGVATPHTELAASRTNDSSSTNSQTTRVRGQHTPSSLSFWRSLSEEADSAQEAFRNRINNTRSNNDLVSNNGLTIPGQHRRNGPENVSQSLQQDRSSHARMSGMNDRSLYGTSEAVTTTDLHSLPMLTRQFTRSPEHDDELHRNAGSSTLSELLRRYQIGHETSVARRRTDRSISPNGSRDVARQSSRTSLSERSAEARRGLERALRDYRAARRALRSYSFDSTGNDGDRGDSAAVRSSWLREQNALVESIAALTDTNESWQTTDDHQLTSGTNGGSTSVEFSTSSSVPTVAALRAARLAMQRGMDSSDMNDAAEVSNSRRSAAVVYRPRNLPELPNAENVIIVDSESRRPRRDREDSYGLLSSSRRENGTQNNTGSGVRPYELNANSRRRLDASLLRSRLRNPKVEETPSRKKAKATLEYLTQLKQAAWNGSDPKRLAQEMGIDSVKESLEKGIVCDLPLRLDELPVPSQSSWLECGVSWSGEQATGAARLPSPVLQTSNAEVPIWAQSASRRGDDTHRMLSLRARRHRERIRAERLEREQQLQNPDPTSDRAWSNLGLPLNGSIEMLADMERHLSDLLEEEEQRLQSDDGWTMPESLLGRQRTRLTSLPSALVEDRWPVRIELHAIDLEKMTVQGTMSASHIPNRSRSALRTGSEQEDDKTDSKPIESFFDGEIIDFNNNELETRDNKAGYKCGGLAIDIQYWAGLGPFREEVERQKNVIRYEKQMEIDCGGPTETESSRAVLEVIKTGTKDTYESVVKSLRDCAMMDDSALDNDENDRAIDEAMIRCLGSKKWMDAKLGKEWILMRWKERCFVTPSSTYQASSASQPRASSASTSTFYASNDPSSWGLTISGFYYVAMHRQTGKIEGLYYDPGSQPFQRLEMWPVDSGRKTTHASNSQQQSSARANTTVPSNLNFAVPSSNSNSISHMLAATDYNDDLIGVRKWFPAIEFR